MSNTIHAPGMFCWAELGTSDCNAAKKFYSALMGWETLDDPIPGGGTYTMLRYENGNVGGMYPLEHMKAAGVPPHWLSYVTVKDAAATAKKAKALGANVLQDAMDVMDIGSMAVLQDPTGAAFAIWQPKKHHGSDFVGGKVGSMCWVELATNNTEKVGSFYAELFGWQPKVQDMGGTKYTVFMSDGAQAAGMMQMAQEWGNIPPHWMVYFSVAACDASAQKAASLGGQILVPPTDIPTVGRFSVLQDPQGAAFAIVKLELTAGG